MAKRPNFIVFLTDDQGYGDLSCMGGTTDFQTPRRDRLAAEARAWRAGARRFIRVIRYHNGAHVRI
ncbi:MAG TPA: hypothetical protein VFZ25_18535 [Chloroflexota bacterium]|nr:hypothetical protein [Chloroflexota bacterium]